eukprot:4630890-Amphidinium_carterae.2
MVVVADVELLSSCRTFLALNSCSLRSCWAGNPGHCGGDAPGGSASGRRRAIRGEPMSARSLKDAQ